MAKCNTLIECIRQTKVNLPEFQRDCIKIVDFLLITNFGTSLIFFGAPSISIVNDCYFGLGFLKITLTVPVLVFELFKIVAFHILLEQYFPTFPLFPWKKSADT